MSQKLRRIEICGGIASGKTTLCKLMATIGWAAIYENFKLNPFWSLFYKNPELHSFETEITFHLQHYSQIKIAVSKDEHDLFCDFSLLQDLAYAKVNLTDGPLNTFEGVYKQVVGELSLPSLLVHLECDPEEELARIVRRARPEERGMKIKYLDALNREIARCVNDINGKAKTLTIDSKKHNFATDKVTQQKILALISNAVVS